MRIPKWVALQHAGGVREAMNLSAVGMGDLGKRAGHGG
jgi:hypothetical protein